MKGNRKAPAVTTAAPDGGWGWVVAVGSLLNVALVIGVARCGGLLYATLPNHFGISRSTAAILAAVNGVVLCLVGPISGALLNRFSCRQITIASGFICCGGLLIAAFATSPVMFVVGFGLIAGTGSGLYLVPSKMIVTQYFDKRRPLVLGLVISGSCVGGITIPPLMEWLMEKYSLEGALLVISAIMLHFIPCGMTYIPLKTIEESKMADQASKSVETISSMVSAEDNHEVNSNSVPDLNTVSKTQTVKKLDGGKWQIATNGVVVAALGDGIVATGKPSKKDRLRKAFRKGLKATNLAIFCNGHFMLICVSACCPHLGFSALSLTLPEYAMERCIEPVSLIQAAFLLSLLSVGDVIGRITMSWLISSRFFRTKHCFIASCACSAIAMTGFPFVDTYTWLGALTVVYGVLTGASNVMPVLLINEYLSRPKLAASYGYLLLILAVPIMIVSPLMGQVRDATGGYVVSYWVISGIVLSGTFPWIVEMMLECKMKRKTFWMENSSVL